MQKTLLSYFWIPIHFCGNVHYTQILFYQGQLNGRDAQKWITITFFTLNDQKYFIDITE